MGGFALRGTVHRLPLRIHRTLSGRNADGGSSHSGTCFRQTQIDLALGVFSVFLTNGGGFPSAESPDRGYGERRTSSRLTDQRIRSTPKSGPPKRAVSAGSSPAWRAIRRVADIRSRSVRAGDRAVSGYTHSARRHAGCRLARVDSARPRWAATPQRNGAIFAVRLRMDSNARPISHTGGAVLATSVLKCDSAERALRIHGDHSRATSQGVLEGDGPLRVAPRARPHQAANRAASAGGCLHHCGRPRRHAHHSFRHPRAVQLLLIDQRIASALPLAQ